MHAALIKYPFLLEIPDAILARIDLNVLHIPTGSEQELITGLSSNLMKNIVVYKEGAVSTGVHLCRVLRSASITQEQLEAINAVENLFKEGQIVVAYDNPLVIEC
ncbi:hypothetical protein WBG78_03090 [Chryseolinea sp. T2]|uniref:hypothetical protein n=1 Tax=Chryseolinea sp. T2 TaxID=3129255 RepID=UPI0030785BCD